MLRKLLFDHQLLLALSIMAFCIVIVRACIQSITTIFPFNELTTRMPAILGAAVYIGSAAYLCVLLTARRLLQFALFVCLAFNPLVLDYLVAARGYSLALGFLAAALALFSRAVLTKPADVQAQWISILLALSFAANFSFGIADGTVLLFAFLWGRTHRGDAPGDDFVFRARVPGGLCAGGLSGLELPERAALFRIRIAP
jgi:hypothetical protein